MKTKNALDQYSNEMPFYIHVIIVITIIFAVLGIVNTIQLVNGELIQLSSIDDQWEVYEITYDNCIENELEIEYCQKLALKESGLEDDS